MENEKRVWSSIQIRYIDGEFIEIRREDLEKIEAIDDVIDALKRGKDLIASLRGILGE